MNEKRFLSQVYIVSEAIRKGLMLAENRDKVRFARGLMEFECEYIKKGQKKI